MSKPPAQPVPAVAKKKKMKPRSQLYEVTPTSAKLKNKKCPRCGSLMATHSQPTQRWVCGSCSFTDYGSKT